ncbi:MAG TPA: uroporphyrinogen decarboxylase family protein [Spirochaetota bacterium]|nr:uroporphyrinogen decarboxylase family protein [Spirochaetota bacterium]
MNIGKIISALREGIVPPPNDVPAPVLKFAASAISMRGKISGLTSVERTFSALFHREPDHVPVTPLLCSAARQIQGISFPDLSLDGEKAAEVFYSGWDFVGGDLIVLMLDLSVEAADFGQAMEYPDMTTARPDYTKPVIKNKDGYGKLKPVKLSEAVRMQEFLKLCRIMVKRVGLRGLVGGFVFGPAGILSMLRGAENFFKDCMLYPDEVRKACETVTGVLIEYAEAQCDAGVPAIAIDTLFASASGLPKKVWENIEGPFVRDICDAIRAKGCMVGVHNCGHSPFADVQLKWAKPDVLSIAHLPDDCRDIVELKEKYGRDVTIIGYIPTQLLIHGSPSEVMDECRRQIDVLGKGGGYIMAPGCEYPPNIPLTNAFAMMEAAKRFG